MNLILINGDFLNGGGIDKKKYKGSILKLLQYINSNPSIISKLPTIARSASHSYELLKHSKENWKFKTAPQWQIPIRDDKLFRCQDSKIVLGATIESSKKIPINSVSSLLILGTGGGKRSGNSEINIDSCCNANGKKQNRVLRRVHFDYGYIPSDLTRPDWHFQIGGKISPIEDLPTHYCLDHLIELPRFPSPPIDIFLLFDLTIRQIKLTEYDSIIKEENWRSLIKKHYDIMSLNYYKNMFHISHNDFSSTDRESKWSIIDMQCGGSLYE